MKKLLVLVSAIVFAVSGSFASDLADRQAEDIARLKSAGEILDEIMSAPDKGVPEEIMGSARCIAVVPGMKKAGFVVGGYYGKGVVTCRTASGWSAPAFFVMDGGSFGLQIGGQEIDLVMIAVNDTGMAQLLKSKVKLGANASVAAGPVGRHAEGMTDWKMRAAILTYSRARGLFAGLEVNGASIRQDNEDTRGYYGRLVPFRTTLTGNIPAPASSQAFTGAVAKYATKSDEKSEEKKDAPAATATPAGTSSTPPATSTEKK